MKKLLLLALTGFMVNKSNAQANIAAARAAAVGSTVTIRGIVTTGSELGARRYIQDPTGGISISGGIQINSINEGDSIVAVGTLAVSNNMLYISSWTGTVLATGKPVPAPAILSPNQLNESTEGISVRVNNCTFTNTGNFTSTAYTVTSVGQQLVVYISGLSTLVGNPIPTVQVDFVGISSQDCTSPSSGCTSGYRLLARDHSEMTVSGIRENSLSASLLVYPNPVEGKINFSLEKGEDVLSAIITDVLGRIVYSSSENTSSIDTEHLPNGVYNLAVQTKGKMYQTKFVVSK